jgi:hypothetical protein
VLRGVLMNELDWIDLPNDDYNAVLGYETQNTIELDLLIRKYNQIPKDLSSALPCRMRSLNQILDLIENWTENHLESVDKKKHLIWIFEIAYKKRSYLGRLLEIYENKLHEEEAQNTYHSDVSSLKDTSKTPIFLNNHRFFSLKMREYWGDFWFETLDPCHRRLTPFLDQWRALKKTETKTPHFFLWLETEHIPKYVPRVTYLKGEELERRRVVVKEGLFWEKSDLEWTLANFNHSSERYLFSIDVTGEIYVAEEKGGISHSSFTCGKPVLGAGLLKVSEGLLISLALESGHYMPSIEIGYQILKILEEKGATFPDKVEIVFFHDRNKYKAELIASPMPSLDQFQEVIKLAYTSKKRGCRESNAV